MPRIRHSWCSVPFALGCLGTLTACGPDPLYREGSWNPSHVNGANLTLMVANPADLRKGSGTTLSDGQIATAAIERLRMDKVKKLPASDVATIATGNSGDNNGTQSGTQ